MLYEIYSHNVSLENFIRQSFTVALFTTLCVTGTLINSTCNRVSNDYFTTPKKFITTAGFRCRPVVRNVRFYKFPATR